MSLLHETLTNTFSGFNDVGFRNDDIITPNIDSLAREGMILSQSYVQPLCTPSRAAFLTGMYPFHIGRQVLHQFLISKFFRILITWTH